MSLKAILFDFNGVIINDEPIHQELIDQVLLKENLRPIGAEYRELCLGKSDRSCLRDILASRGRVVNDDYLDSLIKGKSEVYQERLAQLETLPIYPDLKNCLQQIKQQGLLIGLVSGALRSEIELVLQRAGISQCFHVIVAGDDLQASQPEPDGYLLALDKFREKYPQLDLQPGNFLVIEDTLVGIQAAKQAGMQVVGVAHTYPFHMLQRLANWSVDYLEDLELERVIDAFCQV